MPFCKRDESRPSQYYIGSLGLRPRLRLGMDGDSWHAAEYLIDNTLVMNPKSQSEQMDKYTCTDLYVNMYSTDWLFHMMANV